MATIEPGAETSASTDDDGTTPSFAVRVRSSWSQMWSGTRSTVDLVHSTQTPLPLAPIDYTDPDQVTAVLDLAARIGGLLLACGSPNNDTVLQIKAVTAAYGLTRVQVDITLTSVTVYHLIGARRTPITAMRVVDTPVPNFERLRQTDRLMRQIRGGQISLEDATVRAEEIEDAPSLYRLRIIYLGWALLAASVSLLLGASLGVATIAAFVTLAIVVVIGELSARGLPMFFQNAAGGFIATISATSLYAIQGTLGFEVQPGRIIASGIIVMLAGLTLVQSLQDGMTGAPVTGSARFFDTMLLTGGIIAGIALGLELSAYLGISLPAFQAAPDPTFTESTVRVFAGTAASLGFAVASNAGPKALSASGITALLGSLVYYLVLLPAGFHPASAAGVAATLVGLAGGLLARRSSIPPLITAIAGITPFLPGMSIYRGLHALLHDEPLMGFASLASALGIATALAAGVVLGEWIARQLRRPRALTRDGELKRPKWNRGKRVRGAVVKPKRRPLRSAPFRFKGGAKEATDR
ncbi:MULTISPECIES: threonine/serine exporter ThrE [unclassified Corynebacterium]|uniref:threonine/serine exporter ThrE n=1 Tax=unclassified Corynebacterium TaxID=2624378 RepID=UPI00309E6021